MNYKVEVTIHLKPDILDPQGKTVNAALGRLGFDTIKSVRVGKSIELEIEAQSIEQVLAIAERASSQLLANPVMEIYRMRVL